MFQDLYTSLREFLIEEFSILVGASAGGVDPLLSKVVRADEFKELFNLV